MFITRHSHHFWWSYAIFADAVAGVVKTPATSAVPTKAAALSRRASLWLRVLMGVMVVLLSVGAAPVSYVHLLRAINPRDGDTFLVSKSRADEPLADVDTPMHKQAGTVGPVAAADVERWQSVGESLVRVGLMFDIPSCSDHSRSTRDLVHRRTPSAVITERTAALLGESSLRRQH
jgi:hypothetical protein